MLRPGLTQLGSSVSYLLRGGNARCRHATAVDTTISQENPPIAKKAAIRLGLVTYSDNAQIETVLDEPGLPSVNLGSDWLTQDYAAIDTLQRHKQAGHYSHYTGTGYGLQNAMDAGYTIHTLSVGVEADRNLMRAIAFAGGGTWIDVPGSSTVAAMEEQMRAAFAKIAAKVTPAKLLKGPNEQ